MQQQRARVGSPSPSPSDVVQHGAQHEVVGGSGEDSCPSTTRPSPRGRGRAQSRLLITEGRGLRKWLAGAWARTWRLLGRDPAPGGEGSPHPHERSSAPRRETGCCVCRAIDAGTVPGGVEGGEGANGGGISATPESPNPSNLPFPFAFIQHKGKMVRASAVRPLRSRTHHGARGQPTGSPSRARARLTKKSGGLAPTTKTRPLAPFPARAPLRSLTCPLPLFWMLSLPHFAGELHHGAAPCHHGLHQQHPQHERECFWGGRDHTPPALDDASSRAPGHPAPLPPAVSGRLVCQVCVQAGGALSRPTQATRKVSAGPELRNPPRVGLASLPAFLAARARPSGSRYAPSRPPAVEALFLATTSAAHLCVMRPLPCCARTSSSHFRSVPLTPPFLPPPPPTPSRR
jgi:hypothetical protein